MIVQRVNEHQFIDAFRTWDTYKNNFSYEGLKALYEYFEEFAECQDSKTFELDVIAICCDFTEYENFEDFQAQHNMQDLKYVTGGDKDCLDYYTTIILPESWETKHFESTEPKLPFIAQNF